jgi:hypothetical protein
MHGRYWLLRSSDQVFVWTVLSLHDLVQLLVELLQLRGLGHVLLEHEVWGLIWLVAFVKEEFESVVDHGEIEEEAIACQAEPSVTSNLDSPLRIVAIQARENFVV